MSSVTPLLDTLLATKLAQRVDLVPLKGQTDVGQPVFANQVAQVGNDVRLSSRELLQQQLGVAASGGGSAGGGAAYGQAAPGLRESVILSAAAQALTAILDPPETATSRIFGATALWPDADTPADTPQLTATLARTVENSGLFYESHLQQFAAGMRTLTQLTQEPQAQPLSMAPRTADMEAARVLAPQPDAAATSSASAPAVHPANLSLVRQQLELLAQPQFRWSGEAWPGTTMDWDIAEDEKKQGAAADDPAAAPRWTTRLAMSLPNLGAVEARLSLAGNTLQLRLAARESATVNLLDEAGAELPARLGAQGLQLTGLQVGALAAAPAGNA